MTSASEVERYRTGIANLLEKLVPVVGEIEQWLDISVDGNEVPAQTVLEQDPTGTFRIMCALLLRKANIHTLAVIRANKTNNLHSLAVQMRPVLECAGQVVLIFHNLMIEQEHGVSVVGRYLNSDYFRTSIRITKGDVGKEQLFKMITEASGMSEEEVRDGRSLKQEDKVAALEGGKNWYRYLSEYFSHGRAQWRGHSWQGAVNSMNTVLDEFSFAGMIDYLVNQLAVMNAYASLCPCRGRCSTQPCRSHTGAATAGARYIQGAS